MSGRSSSIARFLAAAIPYCALTGCSVGPDFHRPEAPNDRAYTTKGASKAADSDGPRFIETELAEANWWRVLRCPALDRIVDRALAANPGLDAARATLRRNQDSLRAGYGVFFPEADAKASIGRQHYNPAPGAL